jgi:hypothetical protein
MKKRMIPLAFSAIIALSTQSYAKSVELDIVEKRDARTLKMEAQQELRYSKTTSHIFLTLFDNSLSL